ncbi:MAG: LamG domain-containing protein [Planctomycetota bacterium]
MKSTLWFWLVLAALVCSLGPRWYSAEAAVTDVIRLQMGESDSGPSARVDCKATGAEFTATGSPSLTEAVAERARDKLESTHAITFESGDGFTLKGLPANPKNNIGVELWVKPTAQGGFRNLVNFGGSSGIGIAQQNEGVWGMVYGKASVGFQAIKPEQWVHLAVVIDNGVGRFFVNGQPAGQAPNATSWGYPRSRSMTLGLPAQKGHRPFEGIIDEVRVFTFEPGAFDPSDLLYINEPKEPELSTQDAGDAAFDGTVAEIIFDRTPQENGLTFDRSNMSYASANGKSAWRANRSTLGRMAWIRDANLTFTDPAFRNGAMPVVDVEAVVRLNTWAGITAYADTERGSTRGGMTWGASPNWRTLRFQLDDAHFGGRDHNSSNRELQSDGHDLRLFGANQPLYVHRVTVRGYARTGDVDWARLIRATRPRGDGRHADNELLMFSADESIRLRMPIRNLALEPTTVAYTFRLIGGDDAVVAEKTGNFALAPDQSSSLDLTFDTSGWDLGPYRYEYRLDHPSKNVRLAGLDGHVGIYEPGDIRKAEDGEFLFGLQHTGDPLHSRNAAWLSLMGVDILRNGLKTHTQVDTKRSVTDATYAELFARGYRVMPMIDPPKPGSPSQYDADGMDPAKRGRELAKKERFLETFARDYADTITYYELGNEPDLKFFYPGPIEEYADSFQRMRQAIKRGNPDAVVMTGGLCFHGKDGDRRARELIALLGVDGVDAWAYHSHGPGYEAQRKGYERQVEATALHNADHLPMIDTETGMAATGEAQLHEQARTVVEKFVFTMSKRSPMTFFFAMHFKQGTGPYTMVERYREPRPVVLAYRNLVRTLRGAHYVSELDDVPSDLRVYHFTDPKTGRQTLVGWSQADQPTTLRVAIKAVPASASTIDLFGNRTPLQSAGGSIEVTIGPDPVFVTWIDPKIEAGETDARLAVLPPLLEPPNAVSVAGGDTASFDVLVRRPSPESHALTLNTRLILNDQAVLEQAQALALDTADATTVRVELEVPRDYATPVLATAWRVHADYPKRASLERVDVQQLRSIEAVIGGVEGAWLPMTPAVEIDALAGGHAERAPAIAMTRIWARADGTFTLGAAADWWMAWSINGQPAYDTLARGNGGGLSATAHTFEAKLKAGWNTVAVRVLSGRGGWKLTAAGPSELAMMLRPQSPPDRVELRLTDAQGNPLTTSIVPVLPMPVAAPIDGRDRTLHPPIAILTPNHVTNFHEAHPDAKRWYTGAADLSARLWIAAGSDGRVEAVVDLIDDRYLPDADTVSLVLENADGSHAVPLERNPQASVQGVIQFKGSLELTATQRSAIATLTILDHDGVVDGPKQRGEISTPVLLQPGTD